jgi:hypothetical protein
VCFVSVRTGNGVAMTDFELGVDPGTLTDDDLYRELASLHRARLDTLRHGPEAALDNHLRRTAELETASPLPATSASSARASRCPLLSLTAPVYPEDPGLCGVAWITIPPGIPVGDRRLCTDVGVSSVPGPHHIACAEYQFGWSRVEPLAARRHAHRHLRRSRFSGGGALLCPSRGIATVMTDDRINSRADDLLPEERAAGSADSSAQAQAILEESDEREYGVAPVPEHRTSGETVTSDDTTR